MIGNKLEQSIIGVFQDDISSTFSINQVSKILKKSYPLINKKSNFFLQEGILKKIDIGKSYQCFLNMQNEKARILMAMNEINKKERFMSSGANKELSQEPADLAERFPIESMILYKKTIIFLCDTDFDHESLKQHSLLTDKYTFVFMDSSRLKDMFMKEKDFRDYHIVLHNPYRFVELISGLRDKLMLARYSGDVAPENRGRMKDPVENRKK